MRMGGQLKFIKNVKNVDDFLSPHTLSFSFNASYIKILNLYHLIIIKDGDKSFLTNFFSPWFFFPRLMIIFSFFCSRLTKHSKQTNKKKEKEESFNVCEIPSSRIIASPTPSR